ncbi:MAG: sulfatase [Bacteroidota bacterium]
MKNFLALIIFTIVLSSCEDSNVAKVAEEKQPNILWIVIEDQSPEFFPFYGDEVVSLPNLERLAAESVIYDRAFAPVPVCSPARSAIATGMYPTTLGTHNMRVYTAYQPQNQPEINVPIYSPIPPKGVKPFTEYMRQAGYYCTNNAKEDYNFEKRSSQWDESSRQATWRNRAEGQPFFSIFNYEYCHESLIWRFGKDSLFVDPADVQVPPYFPDDSVIRHDIAVNYSNLIRVDRQIGQLLAKLEADSLLDETIIFFYSDHGGPFPRHKRSVYETGTRVPMFVRFPSGERKGERIQDMVNFIDLGPTALSLAGIEPPAVMQGVPFLGKYKPTESRTYNFATSDRFDGQYDRKRAVRDQRYKYIRNFKPEIPYAINVRYRLQMPMMLRLLELDSLGQLSGPTALWMADTKPEEELYDLENDPYELNNLAEKPEQAERLANFRKVLDDWMEETNDLGGIDEQTLIDRWQVDRKQQVLPTPEINATGENLTLSCTNTDATLVWRTSRDQPWTIYQEAVPKAAISDTLWARASHIGYQESASTFVK